MPAAPPAARAGLAMPGGRGDIWWRGSLCRCGVNSAYRAPALVAAAHDGDEADRRASRPDDGRGKRDSVDRHPGRMGLGRVANREELAAVARAVSTRPVRHAPDDVA